MPISPMKIAISLFSSIWLDNNRVKGFTSKELRSYMNDIGNDTIINLEAAYAGNPDAQYEAAMYLILKGQVNEAERWLRFASQKNHNFAKRILNDGIRMGFFLEDKKRLHKLSSSFLEQLVTPTPTEPEVNAIDNLLINHLDSKHNIQISE